MLVDQFLAPKILIVSGKGGVGKTTVAAALALVAARHGRTVCIAEVDRKGTLPRLFGGGELSYDPSEIAPGVWGMNIVPEQALGEYLDVQYHMKRVSKVFTSTHFVDYITTAAPGLKDILILGKIWYLEQGRQSGGTTPDFDTIVVDAPAAGHMLTFLSAPMGLSDALRVGPVRRQSDWLVQMLQDPARSRVHLVTLPEEMPVSETLETSEALRSKIGLDAGAVFANGVYQELMTKEEVQTLDEVMADDNPRELRIRAAEVALRLDNDDLEALISYARFLDARRSIQSKHLKALRKGVEDPVVELPFLFSAGLALPDIETLADVIEEKLAAL
ncbi:MAG TPA: ArsA-related P-loop ATPase [Actinomycetota bacterium]|nr:ArsA-related P-loop ATPase [Actinomycetota bacterium]